LNTEAERVRLMQTEALKSLRSDYGTSHMLPVYLSERETGRHSHGLLCALVPSNQIERVLAKPYWDLTLGSAAPDVVVSDSDAEPEATYLRYGRDDGIEPLVIYRDFHGLRDTQLEISEAFRLFHNLYHDRKADRFIKFDDAGDEQVIAVMEPGRILIRLKELRQFLALKQMHLSLQFDLVEFSPHSLESLALSKGGETTRDDLACWALHYSAGGIPDGYQGFSRLVGKRLIAPFSLDKGLEGFYDERAGHYLEFITGVDEFGNEILSPCDPDSPRFLTPVFFRREVLEKYHGQPGKYEVTDGLLRCGHLWHLEIDTFSEDYVSVWLGDLGASLPYNEMFHWRAHNIIPPGAISGTYYRRQILAEFEDSSRPDDLFRWYYSELAKACEASLGWQLLLPLEGEDAYHLRAIRVPATEEQRLFDELVLSLAKLLIDSLNESRLSALIPPDKRSDIRGGISRLESVLQQRGLLGTDGHRHVAFLRALQRLRSAGSAHRKGQGYRKIAAEFGVESKTFRDVFAGILEQAVRVLDYLIEVVESGRLNEDRLPTESS